MFQRRATRTFSLESLEGRELLSSLAAHSFAEVGSIHAEKVTKPKVVTVKGTLKGVVYAAPSNAAVNTNLTAQGKVAGLPGRLNLVASQATAVVGTAIQVSSGSGTFTPSGAAAGSTILMTYSGTGSYSKKGVVTLKISGLVTGGTGTYAGETGTFSATVTISKVAVSLATIEPFTMSFTMKLNPIPTA